MWETAELHIHGAGKLDLAVWAAEVDALLLAGLDS